MGLLMKYKNEIYPPELGSTSDHKDYKQVNYLDLRIELTKKYIYYELYDKRDNFSFDIVNFLTYPVIFQPQNPIMFFMHS